MTRSNQKIVADTIVNLHQQDPKPVVLVGQPQSGKTGCTNKTLDAWIPTQFPYPSVNSNEEILKKHIDWKEKVTDPSELSIIVSGPSDNTLKDQNEKRFKTHPYKVDEHGTTEKIFKGGENVRYIKCSDGKNYVSEITQRLKSTKAAFSFLDEAHINHAENGKIDQNYLDLLHQKASKSFLSIWASATPTFVAGLSATDRYFYLRPGKDYYGISDFLKDNRIFEPHDLRRGSGQKRDSAKSRIAKFYHDVVVPHLLDPVRQGSNQNIAVIRLPKETDAEFLRKELEALMQQTYKNGMRVEFLVFNSKNKNIPQLGNSSDWLGEEAINLPANNVPKIAIILNSYLQGFTIPAKNRIAFWHDLYKNKPMNNTASEAQSVGRNFGYPIEQNNGTKILLSSLTYPLFANREVCEFSRDFYEWCDQNAGADGEIKNFNANSHVWTNSSVKKTKQVRKSYKVRNHHGGKSKKEVEDWWRDNINDRNVDNKIGTTTCKGVNQREWARQIANDLLAGHLKRGRNSCGLYGIISFEGVVWDPSNDDHTMILKKYPEIDPNSSSYVGDFLYVDCEGQISNKTTFTNKTAAPKYLK